VTPKAKSSDEEKDDQDATSAATTESKAEDKSAATPEPPPSAAEPADEQVVTAEVTDEFSFTLHAEEQSADTTAAELSSVDVEQAAVAASSQLTEETIEAPSLSAELKVDKVARVVGQAKSDVISKPEEAITDESEVHQFYQKMVVQVRTVGELHDEDKEIARINELQKE